MFKLCPSWGILGSVAVKQDLSYEILEPVTERLRLRNVQKHVISLTNCKVLIHTSISIPAIPWWMTSLSLHISGSTRCEFVINDWWLNVTDTAIRQPRIQKSQEASCMQQSKFVSTWRCPIICRSADIWYSPGDLQVRLVNFGGSSEVQQHQDSIPYPSLHTVPLPKSQVWIHQVQHLW